MLCKSSTHVSVPNNVGEPETCVREEFMKFNLNLI